MVTGRDASGPFSAVYRNTTTGFELHSTLVGVEASDAAWIDLDNDGDLDLAIAGAAVGGTETFALYQNQNGTFSSLATSVPGFTNVSFDWQDIDNDGWIDLAIGGSSNGRNPLLVFRNVQGEMVEQNDLGEFSSVSVSWVDADLDGDSDLLVAGRYYSKYQRAVIFRDVQDGGYPQQQYLTSIFRDPSVGWVDFDNDGDADILLNGLSGITPTTTLFSNDTSGGAFGSQTLEQAIDLPNLSQGGFEWADVDGDGDLDAFAFGLDESLNPVADVYFNQLQAPNTAPAVPTGLIATPYASDSVYLTWDPATDNETEELGLTYALQVGTSPGGIEIASPMSNVTGRQISGPAPLRRTISNDLTGLQWGGTYYWSVQTIDSSWSASELSTEQTFLFNNLPTVPALSSQFVLENNVAGEAILEVLSDDHDLVSGDMISFSLVAGDGDADNALFSIQGNQLIALESLDFESRATYSIRIRSTDSLGAFREGELSFYVLDANDAPTAIELSKTSVPENAPGAVVANLRTEDQDVGQLHSYEIESDASGFFEIQNAQLRIASSVLLDFESLSQHTLTISTTDDGPGDVTFSQTFQIDVIDVNEIGVSLIDDVNEFSFESNPAMLTELGGRIYFRAASGRPMFGSSGIEGLWVYDPFTGESRELARVARLEYLTVVGDRLYMSGQLEGVFGIIEYDPSTQVTRLVSSSRIRNFAVDVDGKLAFATTSATQGIELGVFDPSTGNESVVDISPGSDSSNPQSAAQYDGRLFLNANDGVSYDLYEFDPTTQQIARHASQGSAQKLKGVGNAIYYQTSGVGTSRVFRFDPDTATTVELPPVNYRGLVNVGDDLYLVGIVGNTDVIYRYDPVQNSYVTLLDPGSMRAENLSAFNGKLYFYNYSGLTEYDPGTGTVVEFGYTQPSTDDRTDSIWNPLIFGEELYFAGTTGGSSSQVGAELWKLDLAGNISIVDDVNKQTFSAEPTDFTILNNSLYFSAIDGRQFSRFGGTKTLWTYDPSLRDSFSAAAEIENPTYITAADGKLYMSGRLNGEYGLVEFDPGLGTRMVVEGSVASQPLYHDGNLYLGMNQPGIGTEMLRYDTQSGVSEAYDVQPGAGSSTPGQFVQLQGDIYFAARADIRDQLHRYDPSTNSIALVDSAWWPRELIVATDSLFYHTSDQEIRRYDSATSTSYAIAPNIQSLRSNIVELDNVLFFSGRVNYEFGFYQLRLDTGAVSSVPGGESTQFDELYEHNDVLYFQYRTEPTGSDIGEYDPDLGIVTAIDAIPGPGNFVVSEFTSFGGDLFFSASDRDAGEIVGQEIFGILASPIAVNDSVILAEDSSREISVMENDRDPNEDPLALIGFSQPSSGSVVETEVGMLRYTPNPDFFGSDFFTYVVDDGLGNEATATVFVSVLPVNDAPAVTGSAIPDVQEDSGTIFIAGWASTVWGAANELDQTVVSYVVSDVSNPALFQSTPSVSPDGTLSYTPALNAFGSSTFVLKVKDSGGTANGGDDTSAPQIFTVSVAPVNDAPALIVPSTLVGATGTSEAVVGIVVDDIEIAQAGSGNVQVSVAASNGTLILTQLGGVTFASGANGEKSWTLQGALDDVNAALASLNYKSDPSFFGADSINVLVDDLGNTGTGGALTDLDAINVTVLPSVSVPVGETATEILRDGDDLVVRKDTANEYFRAPLTDAAGLVVVGQTDSESITITVDGLTGAELPQGIRVIGGEGSGDNDDLILQGSQTITNHEYTTGGPETGVLVLDGLTVFFSEFEPIYDYLNSRSRRFIVGTSGDQQVVLEDDGDLANGRVNLRPGEAGGFERIEFYVPTEDLTVIGNDDNNNITVGELEPIENFAIVILAEDGDDTVDASNYAGTIQIAGGQGDDQLFGGQGVNLIDGGDGNDEILDGGGENLISGGSGVNAFVQGGGLNVFESTETAELGGFSDSYSTDEDATLTVSALEGILANDSLPFDQSVSIELVAAPTLGVLEIDAFGAFVYTPNENANGLDTFTYQISSLGNSSSEIPVTIAINSVNDVPTANDDLIWLSEDGRRRFSWNELLRNDFDGDNDVLTPHVTEFPLRGQLIELSDGTLEYVPEAEFFGRDVFKYSVADSFGGSSTASVLVSISSVEDSPTISLASFPSSVDEGSSVTAVGFFGDADPDSLLQLTTNVGEVESNSDGTWEWTYLPTDDRAGSQPIEISVFDGSTTTSTQFDLTINNVPVTFNAGSNVSLLPNELGFFERLGITFVDPGADDWEGTVDYGDGSPIQALSINEQDKSFNLVHSYTVEDVFTVIVQLKDDDSDFVVSTFDVNVLFNQPPVAVGDTLSIGEDEKATALNGILGEEGSGLLGNDSDPDNDEVTIVAVDDSNISHGILFLDDGVVSFDPNGQFDWLARGESAVMSFTYTIADPSGETSTAASTIVIDGANDVPIVTVNQLLVSIFEGETALNSGSFSDLDLSDDLQFSASIGTVTGLSDGTWTWSWDSQDGPVDSQLVTIGVSDGKASTAIDFQLEIKNADPTPSIISISTVRVEGTQIDVAASATDPAGANDTLTFSYGVLKDGVPFASGSDIDKTIFSFTPDDNGSYEIKLTVSDEDGGLATISETITVANALPQFRGLTTDSPELAWPSADSTVVLTGAFSDAGVLDTHRVIVDWGDGTTSSASIEPLDRTLNASHEYSTGGYFQITVTLTDNDGDYVETVTTAAVQGVGLVGDVLWIIGTDDKDKVKIDRKTRGDRHNREEYIDVDAHLDRDQIKPEFDAELVTSIYIVTLGGKDDIDIKRDVDLPVFIDSGAGDDKIDVASGTAIVYAGSGNDKVDTAGGDDFVDGGEGDDDIETGAGNDVIIDSSGDNRIDAGDGNDRVTLGDGRDDVELGEGNDIAWLGGGDDKAEGDDGDDVIFGQAGDDRIDGDKGNDIIVGGDGDDRIDGDRGFDVLIGGFGADRLDGGSDDDLLIAGWTSYDNDLHALQRVMMEWSSEQDYASRVANLRTGSGSTLAGSRLAAGETVFDDGAEDRLDGQDGRDWFFGSLEDEIKRRRANELLDLL